MRPKPPPRFEDFVAAQTPALLRFGNKLTGRPSEAEDLVQFALCKAWENWLGIERTDDPSAYVRRVMLNRYLTWWRRRGRRESLTATPESGVLSSMEEAVLDRQLVENALRHLTRRQRAVVALRYLEDLSVADTAELLGCSTGTVKSQTAKALRKLRTLLAQTATHDKAVAITEGAPDD